MIQTTQQQYPNKPEILRKHQPMETEPHNFVIEASELGWAPGFVPFECATDLGNGRPLRRERFLDSESGWLFIQDEGIVRVHVLRD